MRLALDSFWRALAYSLHPRVIAWSFIPLLLMVLAAFALGYFYWDVAIAAVQLWLEQWALVVFALQWLETVGLGFLQAVLAPLIVLLLATPLIVLATLLLVAVVLTPVAVELVARRRFAGLERQRGGSWLGSLGWSLGHSALALLALLISLPLWLIPPLVLVLPPLILGWLTYRVLAFDALAEHASRAERHALLRRHRTALLLMGVFSGFLGAAPSLLWASGAMFIAMAPLLVPLAVWVYTWVFALASLWFVHYLLAALQALRAEAQPSMPTQQHLDAATAEPVRAPEPAALPFSPSTTPAPASVPNQP
ncbi:EI24 domain-containing protein [Serpentinimonas barnesii]|uniref:EI24 domain-containing protein n=1 Tax=Serpentinimonas barnesii TaxID=1458427 RepID=UPI0004984994|nr:EI24 domain-containing protein [Serpentinimonas barnesii]